MLDNVNLEDDLYDRDYSDSCCFSALVIMIVMLWLLMIFTYIETSNVFYKYS